VEWWNGGMMIIITRSCYYYILGSIYRFEEADQVIEKIGSGDATDAGLSVVATHDWEASNTRHSHQLEDKKGEVSRALTSSVREN